MAKVIRLTENQFSEMMAYHGSNSDFDRFNHKKYLSTGAGSQVFGWGTYVTDDKAVATGYLEKEPKQTPKMSNEDSKEYIRKNFFMCEDSEAYEEIWGLLGVYSTRKACIKYWEEVLERDAFDVGLPDFDLERETEAEHKLAREAISLLNSITDSQYYDARNFDEKMFFEHHGILYEVEIPDDNGFNYLSWYDNLTNEQITSIIKKLVDVYKRYGKNISTSRLRYKRTGEDFYKFIRETFGIETRKDAFSCTPWSGKATSLFLMQCGFDGIKYPAGTRWQKPDGASENAMNYVIFDANKVKIVNKTSV